MDARAKVPAFLMVVVVSSIVTTPEALLAALAFTVLLVGIFRAPVTEISARYLMAIPFIAFASLSLFYTNGMDAGLLMFSRISICVVALMTLITTTPFPRILDALRTFKVPEVLLLMLFFMHRYQFILRSELASSRMARKARLAGNGGHLFDRRAIGAYNASVGQVLVRAYERGKGLYDSLVLRGYCGRFSAVKGSIGTAEVLLIIGTSIMSFMLLVLDRGWYN